MKFVDYYLENKADFPEMDFFEVTYSGNNNKYNLSYNKMKYLERNMIIMIPKVVSQIVKKNLKNIIEFQVYAYFNDLFFKKMTESEINKYENLFLTPDNKILLPIKKLLFENYYEINLKEFNETGILLKMINSFLDISGLEPKYTNIRFSDPEYSYSWCIDKDNFTDINETHLKLIDYINFESAKVNFKKINFKG